MFKKFGHYFTVFGESKRCVWCGDKFRSFGDYQKTKEHVVPRAVGSNKGNKNITAAHRICNIVRNTHQNWLPYTSSFEYMPCSQKKWLTEWLGKKKIKEFFDYDLLC